MVVITDWGQKNKPSRWNVAVIDGCSDNQGISCRNVYNQKYTKQAYIPVGCVPPASVVATRCQCWGSLSRGLCRGKGSLSRRGLPPPWTEWLTHASENITLPQTSFADGKKRLVVIMAVNDEWLYNRVVRWDRFQARLTITNSYKVWIPNLTTYVKITENRRWRKVAKQRRSVESV